MNSKYMLVGRGANLRGTPANITLAWNVMPRVGKMNYIILLVYMDSLNDSLILCSGGLSYDQMSFPATLPGEYTNIR